MNFMAISLQFALVCYAQIVTILKLYQALWF